MGKKKKKTEKNQLIYQRQSRSYNIIVIFVYGYSILQRYINAKYIINIYINCAYMQKCTLTLSLCDLLAVSQ